MIFKHECHADRWIAVFDLLGTRQLLADGREWKVHDAYSQAVQRVQRSLDLHPPIERLWFSDTFALYSHDDTDQSYVAVDVLARSFFSGLVLGRVPARGALSHGPMYVDRDKNIVFGSALVEAYTYGDSQDWLGFIISPSAVVQLHPRGFPSPLNYVNGAVPWSHGRKPRDAPMDFPIFVLGRDGSVDGKNPFVPALHDMAKAATKKAHRSKYERTLAFVQQYDRLPRITG